MYKKDHVEPGKTEHCPVVIVIVVYSYCCVSALSISRMLSPLHLHLYQTPLILMGFLDG